MAGPAAFFRRRLRRLFGGREAAPGDPRTLSGLRAEQLARATSILKALDQAIAAITLLRRRRISSGRTADAEVQDLALLQFGIVQFIDCLDASESAGLPGPDEIYGGVEAGLAFCGHLRTFRDQLCGPHARLVGATESVALLRRVNGHAVLQGIVTRSLRPDRLTASELGQMSMFMQRAREGWAGSIARMHSELLVEARTLTAEQLDQLPVPPQQSSPG